MGKSENMQFADIVLIISELLICKYNLVHVTVIFNLVHVTVIFHVILGSTLKWASFSYAMIVD